MPSARVVAALRPLVGRWKTTIHWSPETHKIAGGPPEVTGEARFTWLLDESFLHYEFGPSHWIITADDASREYTVLYGDNRKVARVYRMMLSRGTWRMWRDAPGFHQRFVGRFRDNRRTIVAKWEKSADGREWEHDFDVVYRKKR